MNVNTYNISYTMLPSPPRTVLYQTTESDQRPALHFPRIIQTSSNYRCTFSLIHCKQIRIFYICKLKCKLIFRGDEWESNHSSVLSELR